jgi:hypothetical protein
LGTFGTGALAVKGVRGTPKAYAAANPVKAPSNVEAVIAETIAGKGNIKSKTTLTAEELLQAGEEFLEAGYGQIGKPDSGVFRSADGLRQFRIDSNSLLGKHAPGVPHGHLEINAFPNASKPSINNHIPFLE